MTNPSSEFVPTKRIENVHKHAQTWKHCRAGFDWQQYVQ